MRAETVSFLLDLNRQFYQQFGLSFATTRQRLQPGVRRLLERLPLQGRWLDLGSGNGQLGRELVSRGFEGEYTGVDFSRELVYFASSGRQAGQVHNINFLYADLSDPGWDAAFPPAGFNTILAFAVLHHLPGEELRLQVLGKVHRLLAPGGQFFHSEWQFHRSPRLLTRIQPWQKVGLDPTDLDEGDALLDWRHTLPGQPERTGLRYVHRFSREELARLAEVSGFEILETFESDGEGGRLGLYQVWSVD
jgi:tRNA (uracil-5-)-methyltransferase TRM9